LEGTTGTLIATGKFELETDDGDTIVAITGHDDRSGTRLIDFEMQSI
jgi:hypothetical protein